MDEGVWWIVIPSSRGRKGEMVNTPKRRAVVSVEWAFRCSRAVGYVHLRNERSPYKCLVRGPRRTFGFLFTVK